jgi:hypothetical protein
VSVIITEFFMTYGPGSGSAGTPLDLWGSLARRKGVDDNHQRAMFVCDHACRTVFQQLLLTCPDEEPKSDYG